MKLMQSGKPGVTLVEMAIGIAISTLLIVVLLNFFSYGVRGSQRGIEHLNNMGIASILMSQIEYDLLRTSRFILPLPGKSDSSAQWEFPADSAGGIGTISYRVLPEGIEREERRAGEVHKYIYCKGRTANLSFDNLTLTDPSLAPDKTGVLVALFVARPPKDKEIAEEFKLIRLVTWRNIIK